MADTTNGMIPSGLSSYAHRKLDSIGKIINHMLVVSLVCDIILFFASISVSVLPNLGLNAVVIALILMAQTVFVFLVLNNYQGLRFLSPTALMVGVSIGVTVGAALLALVLSRAYKGACRVAATNDMSHHGNLTSASTSSHGHGSLRRNLEHTYDYSEIPDPLDGRVYHYYCDWHHGAMVAVSFWSGLIFWLNLGMCVLLTLGQEELIRHDQTGGYPEANGTSSSFPSSFVGNYSNIPEIHAEQQQRDTNNKRQQQQQQQQQLIESPYNSHRIAQLRQKRDERASFLKNSVNKLNASGTILTLDEAAGPLNATTTTTTANMENPLG